MPWVPHGKTGFGYWASLLDYPIVAIGGIHADRIQPMLELGADGIAMITAITQAEAPMQTTQHFLHHINEFQQQHVVRK